MEELRYDQYIRTNGSLAYVAITKCASTSLKRSFAALGWETINTVTSGASFDNQEFFAVVREPIERWISGFTQYFYRDKEGRLQQAYDNFDALVKETVFDIHQLPQISFTDPWPISKFFKFERLDLLCDWLKEKGAKIELQHHNPGNNEETFEPKRQLYQWVEQNLTAEHRDYLLDFYKRDVELYQKAIPFGEP